LKNMDRETIGRYEILNELGRGAMGRVFRARDSVMGRVVALKSLLSASLAGDQAQEFRERFYREAQAAGALAHPGIVPVFDVGEDDGVPFLVMEYVQGRTLAEAVKQGERYTLDHVCEIGRQLAEALGYAHRHGVIHRDIKPANILMTSREVYGVERPRITDFGVAKLVGGDLTGTGQLLGTPAFMPPELFTGAPVDGRTDLFSLGVILYKLATAEQPFPGETLTAVSYKVVHTEAIPPSKLNPAISPQLEAVILKCLAKNPDQRYQTGEELAGALAALLPGAQASGLYSTAAVSAPFVSSGSAETIVEIYSTPRPAPQVPMSYLPPAASTQTVPFMGSHVATTSLPSAAEFPGLQKRHWWIVLALLILVAVAVAGTTFFLTVHQRPQQQGPPNGAVVPPMAPAAPNSNALPMQGGGGGAPAELTSQDPSLNTHLNLDLSEIPPSLNVALEMDGKVFWRSGSPGDKSSPGDKPSHQRLLVPPGKHEFRVIVSGSGEPKSSNIVKAASDPSMRLTLAVSIQPRPNMNAVALDPATRVVATLRLSGLRDAAGRQPGDRSHAGPQQQQPPRGQNAAQQ
jgi:serine/threonine protein kinase